MILLIVTESVLDMESVEVSNCMIEHRYMYDVSIEMAILGCGSL